MKKRVLYHSVLLLSALWFFTILSERSEGQQAGSNLTARMSRLEHDVSVLKNRVTELESALKPNITAPASKAAWRQLQLGMTMGQVKDLLGESGEVSNRGRQLTGVMLVVWYYPDALGGHGHL